MDEEVNAKALLTKNEGLHEEGHGSYTSYDCVAKVHLFWADEVTHQRIMDGNGVAAEGPKTEACNQHCGIAGYHRNNQKAHAYDQIVHHYQR